MNGIGANNLSFLLAQQTAARTVYEWNWPETPFGWTAAVLLVVAVTAYCVWLYRRDTVELPVGWRVWLTALRLTVLAALAVVALNPQRRTQKLQFQPSRVVLLVDRSLSMQLPARSPTQPPASSGAAGEPSGSDGDGASLTRAEAVRQLLLEEGLLRRLQRTHQVSVYAFDSKLVGPLRVFPPAGHGGQTSVASATGTSRAGSGTAGPSRSSSSGRSPAEPDAGTGSPSGSSSSTAAASERNGSSTTEWVQQLQPLGAETRLGEAVLELLRQVSGRTLSGVVVLTDGASNAGLDPSTARAAAEASRTRLVAVGVGALEEPANIAIASVQAPTDVQLGDPFDLSAFVQGTGVGRTSVTVELLQKTPDVAEPTLLESRPVSLSGDGVPAEVRFQLNPGVAGEVEYTVRVSAPNVVELNTDDNQRTKTVNVVDRKLRVLLVAGGPMREYRFVRNMLFRHSSVELDVWLQTVHPGTAVSQDADRVLTAFPSSREELFQYDVLVAFDPDWTRIPPEGLKTLVDWVFSQSGGLILVAGDIYTPQLAGGQRSLKPVLDLYPVVLTPFLLEYQLANESRQAWPIRFTQAGREADFLQVTDDPYAALAVWKKFPGIYRCYPTSGAKAGATVYAYHTDPRAQTEQGPPILIASQFYGSGQVLYLGSPEFWRLRALSEDYYDRLWTKLVRKVGQARMQRGTARGLLLLERTEYQLGQTVTVRAQLLDPQFRPLEAPSVAAEVFTPAGKPLQPELRLLPDKTNPGQYVGTFRAALPGTYRIEVPVPQSRDVLSRKIDVVLPNRETDQARQNVQLLRELVAGTGGAYVPIEDALEKVPQLLPNHSEESLVNDRLETLWDRPWVLLTLVLLLSLEWLTRKLLKLA